MTVPTLLLMDMCSVFVRKNKDLIRSGLMKKPDLGIIKLAEMT